MIDFACKSVKIEEVIKCSFGLTKAELGVLNFLLKHLSTQFSSDDLAEKTKLDLSTIQRTLKKLHERDILLRTQKNMDSGGYFFVYELKNKKHIHDLLMKNIQGWVKRVERVLKTL